MSSGCWLAASLYNWRVFLGARKTLVLDLVLDDHELAAIAIGMIEMHYCHVTIT